jgi:hypothetical protein
MIHPNRSQCETTYDGSRYDMTEGPKRGNSDPMFEKRACKGPRSKFVVIADNKRSMRVSAHPKKVATHAYDNESLVMDRAVQVIGDANEAMRWMGTPVRALDYSTPVSLLGIRKGRRAVIDVLGRLEHGVLFSAVLGKIST